MRRRAIAAFGLVLLLTACGGNGQGTTASSATATPTASRAAAYPPKTVADLKALASTGDASAVHEVKSEGVGLASCPQPKRWVLVASSASDPKQIAADLLKYFFAQGLDNECGSDVLAYRTQAEIDSGAPYTVGQVVLNVTDNAPKHDLMANVGDALGASQLSFDVKY